MKNKNAIFVVFGMCVLLMLYVLTPTIVVASVNGYIDSGSDGEAYYDDDNYRTLKAGDEGDLTYECKVILPTMVTKTYTANNTVAGSPTVTLTIGRYSKITGNGTSPVLTLNISDGEDFDIEFPEYGVYYANLSIDANSEAWVNVTVESSGIMDAIPLMVNAIPVIILVAIMVLIVGALKFRGGGW